LPVAAAAGGMVGAAAVYLVVAAATGAPLHAWGVPMATDVAFTLGALSLLGGRVPRELRVLILTLAVADDLGAIVVLGFASSSRVDAADLGAAALVVVGTVLLRRRVRSVWWPYAVMLVLLWVFLARGGVEPAIAGAVVGVLVPVTASDATGARGPLARRLEAPAVPVSTYLVLPLFALANTGVVLGASAFVGAGSWALLLSLVAARVIGKIAGIGLAVAVAIRCGFPLPATVHRHHVLGAAALCGIGFTVPLLFAAEVFGNEAGPLAITRIALLAGSVLAAGIGATILCTGRPRTPGAGPAGRRSGGRTL
ncbi:MAG TPA: Na+/H+ antiporter NhaA, partial [Acidimicrobiales bacterium]